MTAQDESAPRVPIGVSFAIASALLFGLSTPCAKLLLGETPPLLLAGLLYAGSGLGLPVIQVSRADPLHLAAIKGAVAGGVNVALAVMTGTPWPSGALVAGALVVGFLGYGLSLTLFILALRHLGTARTGAYFSLAPFFRCRCLPRRPARVDRHGLRRRRTPDGDRRLAALDGAPRA